MLTETKAERQAPAFWGAITKLVWRERSTGLLTRYGVAFVLVGVIVLFSALRPKTFATWGNVQTMAQNQSVQMLLAFAVLLPLVVGHFDVSLANLLGLTGITCVVLASSGLAVALAGALMVALLIGTINGYFVVRRKVDSFIITIGMSTVLAGLSLAISNGQVLFRDLPAEVLLIGRSSIAGIRMPIIIALVIAFVLWYLLDHTALGRYLYGIGGNKEVARLSGIPVGRLVWFVFIAAATLAWLAGVVELGMMGSADPTFGPSFMMPAFAAAFLGATVLKPGLPNVWGTVLAVTLLNVMTTGLGQLGAPFWVEPIFNGTILILSVTLSALVMRSAPGKRKADRASRPGRRVR